MTTTVLQTQTFEQFDFEQLRREFDPMVLDKLERGFVSLDLQQQNLIENPGLLLEAGIETKKRFEKLRRNFWKAVGGLGISAGVFVAVSEVSEVFAEGNNPPGIPANYVECSGGPGSMPYAFINSSGATYEVWYCPPTTTTQPTQPPPPPPPPPTQATTPPPPPTTQKPAQPTSPPVIVQPTVPAETLPPTTTSEAPVSVTTTTIEEDDATTTTGEKATTTTKGVTTTTENENPTTTTTSEALASDDDEDKDSSNGIPGWVIPVGVGASVTLAFGAKFYLGRDREEHSSDDFGGTGIVAGH